MNILWASNYGSNSGYAIQARLWVSRLQRLGHHVTVLELANGTRLPQVINGVKILPTALDPLGSDSVTGHYHETNSHALITLVDAWGLPAALLKDLNWFPLAPVDTFPVAAHVVDSLKHAKFPIAYSRYGYEQMRMVGLDPAYWPHAVDPQIWKPQEKHTARGKLGIPPDTFFVSFVGVNDTVPSRKGIPELLMAWQVFHSTHSTARLYMHTALHGNLPVNQMGGVKIDVLMKTLGIDPKSVQFVDQYRYRSSIPTPEMAAIAAASDVLVLPTRGEGFGLPLLEFQRVGCPVITTNFASGAELCFSGWLIEYEPEWNWQSAMVAKPGVAAIVEALEAAYEDRDNPARRQRAIEGAREYDVDLVTARYAVPTLKRMAEYVLEHWKAA